MDEYSECEGQSCASTSTDPSTKWLRRGTIPVVILATLFVGCGSLPLAEPPALVQPHSPVEVAAEAPAAHLPFFDSPAFTPRWLEPSDVPKDFHKIPPFSMRNQRGETITEADMDGKVTVVDFFFASCNGICPRLAESMQSIDASFGDTVDLVLLSYSVMPDADTVDVLADYASSRSLESDRWHFLTGDRKTIYALGRQSYFVEERLGVDRDDDEFLHTENLVLLDRQRRIRGIYSGTNRTATSQLIADARRLLEEG